MMNSPYLLMSMFAAYLWMIFKSLPEFMALKKPYYNLTSIIRVYNIFQVLACGYFVVKFHENGFSFRDTWQCTQPKDDEKLDGKLMNLLELHWLFIFLRLFEFIETIFFILRKKFSQVSALHVYHHISTVALLYIHLKFNGGLMDIYIGALNSCVHIIMYCYYFFSSFENLTKFTNKVKPCITFIQIVQLVILFVHCCVALTSSCGAHKPAFTLQSLNLALLISMFLKFYFKNYFLSKWASKKKN